MAKRNRIVADPSASDIKWWASIPTVRRKLRFYANHQFPRESVEVLRSRGIDVWYVQEHQVDRHQDDTYHYQRAREMRRLLLTQDRDYLDDHRHPLHLSPGVIVVDSGASRDPAVPAVLLEALLSPLLRDGMSRIPNLYQSTKLSLTRDQLVHRYRTWDSRVEEAIVWRRPARRGRRE